MAMDGHLDLFIDTILKDVIEIHALSYVRGIGGQLPTNTANA